MQTTNDKDGSTPLEEPLEGELLAILSDPELNKLPFQVVCNQKLDSFGRHIFGPPGPGLRRRVQRRRDYLNRRPRAKQAAITKFFSPTKSSASPFALSPPPASRTSRDCIELSPEETMATKKVDGEDMPYIPLTLNELSTVGVIVAIHGKDVRDPGGRLVDMIQVIVPISNPKDF